jgi:diguanylate cyclase (GGDEF)-like protein
MGFRTGILEWFRKDLSRTIRRNTYIHSDVPTTEELEALKKTKERVLLVIKMRWVLLSLFAMFGLYASYVYKRGGPEGLSLLHVVIPGIAFLLAIAYNAWYHYCYDWLSNYRRINLAQLLLDLMFVTVIVHYSGGAVSWFWAMYFLLILQATFLGESVYDALTVGLASSLLYGAVLVAEFQGILAPVVMPFENLSLQQDFGYCLLKWMWLSSMCILCAGLGTYMIRGVLQQEERLRQLVIKDSLTGVYNRGYFQLRLNSEIRRSERYGRRFALLVLDVDDFKLFNDSHGHQHGDLLLQGVGGVLKECVRRSDTYPPYDMDIPCRIGGEEFAVIMPEATAGQAISAAERLREDIEHLEIGGSSATISIGIAAFPDHGVMLDSLFKAADDAMYLAKSLGKNRVAVAGGVHERANEDDLTLPVMEPPAAGNRLSI